MADDIIASTDKILTEVNKQLDGVTSFLDNQTSLINEEIKQDIEEAQAIVNKKVEDLENKISDKLQPIRDKLVDILSGQIDVIKEKVEQYTAPISAFVTIDWSNGTVTPNIPTDPNDLVEVVTGIIQILVPVAPIEFVVKFATVIFPKVESISDKILTIANYQPQIDDPNVQIPTISVEIEPITLQDIMGE